eukprot:11939_6
MPVVCRSAMLWQACWAIGRSAFLCRAKPCSRSRNLSHKASRAKYIARPIFSIFSPRETSGSACSTGWLKKLWKTLNS